MDFFQQAGGGEMGKGDNSVIEEHIYSSHLSEFVLKGLADLWKAGKLCDAVITVGVHHLKVHKLLIAAINPLLFRNPTDYESGTVLHIDLPSNINFECVKSFIRYLYSGRITLTSNNVSDLHKVSTFFNLEDLKNSCQMFLQSIQASNAENIKKKAVIVEPKSLQFWGVEVREMHSNILPSGDNAEQKLANTLEVEQQKTFSNYTNQAALPSFNSLAHKSESNMPVRKRGRTRCSNDQNIATVEHNLRQNLQDVQQNLHEDTKVLKELFVYSDKEKTILSLPLESNFEENVSNVTFNELVSNSGIDECTSSDEIQISYSTQPKTYMFTRSMGKKKEVLVDSSVKIKGKYDFEKQADGELSPVATGQIKKGRGKSKGGIKDKSLETQSEFTTVASEMENLMEKALTGKRGKSRRVASPEPIVKPEVVMRPPPKKRTKEIREMMEHESGEIVENIDSFLDSKDSEDKTYLPSSSAEKGKGTKPRAKRRYLPRNNAITRMVNEVEQMAKDTGGDNKFKCTLCGNEFIFPKRVVSHILKTHDIDLEEVIKYIFVESKDVLSPKVCDICGYKTKDPNFYYIHYHKYFRHGVPLPKGWKPFTCDICGKECFTKFQLRDHKLVHFEETPFVCEHCGSGFKSRTSLNSHVFHRHSSVRSHQCNQCPKTFKTRTQLLVHFRTHSGEKPFHCPQCHYKSTTRGNMRLHLTNRHKFDAEKIRDLMMQIKCQHGTTDEETLQETIDNLSLESTEISVSPPLLKKGKISKKNTSDTTRQMIVTSDHQGMSQTMSEDAENLEYLHIQTIKHKQKDLNLVNTDSQKAMQVIQAQGSTHKALFVDQNAILNGSSSDTQVFFTDQSIPQHVRVLIHDPGNMQGTQEYRILLPSDFQPSESSGIISLPDTLHPDQHLNITQDQQVGTDNRMIIRDILQSSEARSILSDVQTQTIETQEIQSLDSRSLVSNENLVHVTQGVLPDPNGMVVNSHPQERDQLLLVQSQTNFRSGHRSMLQEALQGRATESPLQSINPGIANPGQTKTSLKLVSVPSAADSTGTGAVPLHFQTAVSASSNSYLLGSQQGSLTSVSGSVLSTLQHDSQNGQSAEVASVTISSVPITNQHTYDQTNVGHYTTDSSQLYQNYYHY
ncbi:hypothetical protein CHS0354_002804 [Potamilus streckersoni]|uniref:Uncharacterized protein n=1 Tax=Potamilus streckersoni TaxID=2493646 RepID=A0AAE0S6N6_9BIVA|nr:hypothetical protein CHS0354_002804 [Potamilus streckersoni]